MHDHRVSTAHRRPMLRRPVRGLIGGIVALSLVPLVLAACTARGIDADPSAASGTPSSDGVHVLATDLRTPWSTVFLADGTPLVSERDTGVIREVADDGSTRRIGRVQGAVHSGEGGLLGLAVHDGGLFAYLTTARDNRVVRFDVAGERGALRLARQQVVLSGLPSASYHNGGRIAFGPDDLLYVTVGDAGRSAEAQQTSSLAGKILRIRPDGTVPADNPFPGSPVFSLGHRNPQGIAWAPDGTLYAAEFGQDTWDELNVVRAGRNYGWPVVEGIARDRRFTDPLQQWEPSDASPSGIAIRRGTIVIANLRGASLRMVPLDDPTSSTVRYRGEFGRLRDVAVAPDGDLWVLTSNTDGRGAPADGDDRILVLR